MVRGAENGEVNHGTFLMDQHRPKHGAVPAQEPPCWSPLCQCSHTSRCRKVVLAHMPFNLDLG